MTFNSDTGPINYKQLILVCIFIGICVTVFLVITIQDEHFSTIYIVPDSYTLPSQGNESTNFIYGIKSFEKKPMDYTIEFWVNNDILEQKQIQLNPGENYEEKKNLKTLDVAIPTKVSIHVNTSYTTYEVHYWLNRE